MQMQMQTRVALLVVVWVGCWVCGSRGGRAHVVLLSRSLVLSSMFARRYLISRFYLISRRQDPRP